MANKITDLALQRKLRFRKNKQHSGGAQGVVKHQLDPSIWYCTRTMQVRAYGSRADLIPASHWTTAEFSQEDIQKFLDDPNLGRWIVKVDEYGDHRIQERERIKYNKILPQVASTTNVANADIVLRTDSKTLRACADNPQDLPLNGELHVAVTQRDDPYSVIFNYRIPVFQIRRDGEISRRLAFEIQTHKHSIYVPHTSTYTVGWEPEL